MSRINCSINNCHYWEKGNICNASEIMVTSDSVGDSQPDSFDAPQASMAQATPVENCMSSCCKTFVESNSQVTEDNVTRNPY